MKIRITIGLLLFLLPFLLMSQNIEELGVKKGLKVNGSASFNSVGYISKGIESRRDPFLWIFSGNLNLNVFGYSTPFSFSYSNANKSYTQPFNQFSFSPQYKWIKTYIGYNSMTFSNYTLAGHVFFGGGVELTPGKWKIAAMHGRLKKAVPYSLTDSTQHSNAAFKRMGTGLKVGYDDGNNFISGTIFTAKDNLKSIPYVTSDGSLTPKENIVLGFAGRKKLLSRIFVEVEYAYSILNNDTRAEKLDTGSTPPLTEDIIPVTSSTRSFQAFNTSLGYQGNSYSVQLKYERIDPEYQTLGAYYFNNDMENITIAPTVQFFNQKITLSGNAGIQHNNLDKNRASSTERLVGTLNGGFIPNEKWSFSASYSNFSTYTNLRPQNDPFFNDNLDSLNFYQITNSLNGTSGYNFGSDKRKSSIMVTVSYQKASDKASFADSINLSNFYTGNISYSYIIVPSNIITSCSFNYYTSEMPGMKSNYWGPNASISKSFLEKTLKSSLASSYNLSTANNYSSGAVMNTRLSLNYSPASKDEKKEKAKSPHSLVLGLNWLQKFKGESLNDSTQSKGYTEFTANFTYAYNF